MSKSIFLFKINDNFLSLQKENNLEIVLDIFLKSFNSNFYKEQFNLILENLDTNSIKENILSYFNNKPSFLNNNQNLIVHNKFKDEDETLQFYDKYLKINLNGYNSIFLEYLSLYFVDLIVIELEEEKIYPLHLVKTNILV